MSLTIPKDNARVWDDIYRSGHSMRYPDDGFVRLFSQLIKTKIPYQGRVLDYGFGSGATTEHMLRQGYQVDGLEISQRAIDTAQMRLIELGLTAKLLHHDGVNLPFEDDSFDAVIAWQVLSYNNFQTMREKLLEIKRLLKPGGVFLASLSMPGSSLEISSAPLNDGLGTRIMNKGNQSGAHICIPIRQQLLQIFSGFNPRVGSLSYELEDLGLEPNSFWIVTFEKP